MRLESTDLNVPQNEGQPNPEPDLGQTNSEEPKTGTPFSAQPWTVLGGGLLIWLHFLWLSILSDRFAFEIPNRDRPIFLATTLLISASVVFLFSIWRALQIKNPSRDFITFIFVFAVAFRLVFLFSTPIQEIDSYRYIWDGKVVAAGHSPYRFSPYQVLQAEEDNRELSTLKTIAFRSESNATILSRIDYSDIRTIYPPVAQSVFGLTLLFVPDSASVLTNIIAMKVAITLFDIATLFLLVHLLALLNMNRLWCMVYGWNPLVIKEFSNSGHLDSIAVFFLMGSLVMAVRWAQLEKHSGKKQNANYFLLVGCAVLLAAGFCAKIFPIILTPIILCLVLRISTWKKSFLFATTLAISSVVIMSPMWADSFRNQNRQLQEPDSREGLTTFLRHWQINELAYMVVYQNLKELDPDQIQDRPWFRVMDERTRTAVLKPVTRFVHQKDAPYVLSRFLTLSSFGFFYLYILVKFWGRKKDFERPFLAGCFVVLAIFFCLQPTQNPWYWIWAIPLLPFSKNRGWMLYSSFLFMYYYRFWLQQFAGPHPVLGENYTGQGLFDFVLVWLEHLPVWIVVLWFSWRNGKKSENSMERPQEKSGNA